MSATGRVKPAPAAALSAAGSSESGKSFDRTSPFNAARAGVQSARPEEALRLFVENPFWTVGGIAGELGVAYTTAQRAVDREGLLAVRPTIVINQEPQETNHEFRIEPRGSDRPSSRVADRTKFVSHNIMILWGYSERLFR